MHMFLSVSAVGLPLGHCLEQNCALSARSDRIYSFGLVLVEFEVKECRDKTLNIGSESELIQVQPSETEKPTPTRYYCTKEKREPTLSSSGSPMWRQNKGNRKLHHGFIAKFILLAFDIHRMLPKRTLKATLYGHILQTRSPKLQPQHYLSLLIRIYNISAYVCCIPMHLTFTSTQTILCSNYEMQFKETYIRGDSQYKVYADQNFK